MNRACASLVCVCVSVVFGIAASVGTAGASPLPPANDLITGAKVVNSLPYASTVNTAGATTDAQDTQANESNPACQAPFGTNNSVWYKFTAGASDTAFFVDTTGSAYQAAIGVETGSPGALTTAQCGLSTVASPTVPGTTYYLLVIDFNGTGGGTLKLHVHGAGPTPKNDLSGGATSVKKLPFTSALDTTGATTDAEDSQVNGSCGAPVTNSSVWYKFTAGPNDTAVLVDTTGSNFSAGAIIATGTPGALTTEACGPRAVVVSTVPGTTYYVLVFDDTGLGGKLKLSIRTAPPPPTLSVAIAAQGTVDKLGNAHLRGTYTCTDATSVEVSGQLVEIVGQNVVNGYFDQIINPVRCNARPHAFTATAFPDALQFAGGQAAEFTFGTACNVVQCTQWQSRQVVALT